MSIDIAPPSGRWPWAEHWRTLCALAALAAGTIAAAVMWPASTTAGDLDTLPPPRAVSAAVAPADASDSASAAVGTVHFGVDWSRIEPSPDPSPVSIAAY